jgi:hypothetical protein
VTVEQQEKDFTRISLLKVIVDSFQTFPTPHQSVTFLMYCESRSVPTLGAYDTHRKSDNKPMKK